MDPISLLREKAKKKIKKIVLPESNDDRVIEAGHHIASEKIAKLILLGNTDKVHKSLKNLGKYDESFIEIVDPKTSDISSALADRFYNKRKHKNSNKDFFSRLIRKNYVYYGAMMVDAGMADGFVAGASHTTSDVAKAAIHCLEVDDTIGVASGSFVMYARGSGYGDEGLFLFADCALVPDPNPKQLAGIAVSSGRLYRDLFDKTPYVAMLSYSTKNSAGGRLVEKVREALKETKALDPDLLVDGELQADSALDPSVALKKTSIQGSPVAGKANVLIFPNLDSGNISYKLVQRLANARAIGPLMQGLKKPSSDLSRGCCVDDVIDAVAVTAVRAQNG
ncbi:MAG: phosphate acetyltransferase [Candidatus Omnitrophica bacterium]|nr:phosphate acetyltransferase [Candidatus Omnitrophota bacterium]